MNTSQNFYSGSILLNETNTNSFLAANFAGVWLDKENKIPNPIYFSKLSSDILTKLYYLATHEFFTTLITLTTKEDLDSLNILLTDISKRFNRYFSVSSILRDNSHIKTEEQAQEFRETSIRHYAKQEVYHILNISNSNIKEDTENFNSLYEDILFRLRTTPNTDFQYFRVLETQHNKEKHPHFHILTTHYIPACFIQEIVDSNKMYEQSRIFDVSYIMDYYLRQKKNKHLFEKFQYNKIDFYHECIENDNLKNLVINSAINYTSKYLTKDLSLTYLSLELKGYKGYNITRFSNGFLKKYPELRRLKTQTTKLGRLRKPLKVPFYKYTFQDYSFKVISPFNDKTFFRIDTNKSLNDKYREFLLHLSGSNLFQYSQNNVFKSFQEDFNQYELSYLTQITKINLKEYNITCNTNLYDEFKSKYLISRSLKYIYENNLNFKFKNQENKLKKALSNLSRDKSQQRVLFNFTQIPIINVVGRAGSGKSYTLSNLGVFVDNETKFIVLTKKKRATQKLKEKYNSLGYTNVFLQNLDSFLIKRGDLYIRNELNCYNEFENYVLILDEIGQITYDELCQILSSINLEKIRKIVFGGDICQDKSFYGNSILDMLKDLDYITQIDLTHNWRSNQELNLIHNSFLENKQLIHYNILDFYENKEQFSILLKEYLLQDYTFIVNSKQLRDYINDICLTFKDVPIKLLVDINYKRLGLVNGDSYILEKKENLFYYLKNSQTGNKIKVSSFIFYRYFIYSYALTVDKTQGDEFENVLVLFDNYSKNLLTHNKLYTAITRARVRLKIFFQDIESYTICCNTQVQNQDLFNLTNFDILLRVLDNLNSVSVELVLNKIKGVTPC